MESYNRIVSNTRRPLTLIVGKPLSQEELMTLIVNEEPIFQMWDKDGNDIAGEKWIYDENLELVDTYIDRGYCGTLRNIIHRKGFHWLDGYIFCDGTIWGSFYEFKYPEYHEYIGKWEILAKRNPFVDMVVSYTDSNESFCYGCDRIDGSRKKNVEDLYKNDFEKCSNKCLMRKLTDTRRKALEMSYDAWNRKIEDYYLQKFYREMEFWLMPADIHRCVQITLHIHDGIVETFWGEEAQKLYKTYNDKYGDFRLWIANNSDFFSVPLFDKSREETSYIKFDDDYMRACFKFMGLKESIYDEYIKPKYLIDINTKTQIVTREWLIAEYDKHFTGTELDIENVKRLLK